MMENENFDEDFKNQIKQVFEEYNDSAANKGWNLLREKYPEKKRRDGLLWWIFAAALLLIALIFGLFYADFFPQNASKIVHQPQTDTVPTFPNCYPSTQKPVLNKVIADTSNTKKTSVKTASDFTSTQRSIHNNQTSLITSQQKLQLKTQIDDQDNTSFTGIKNISDSTINQTKNPILALKDSSKQKTLITTVKQISLELAKISLPKEDMKVKKVIERSSKFDLELYAGPHINYANGSNNQLGLGAGFSTVFRLSNNFKLSTGLGLMQNNLTYSKNLSNVTLLYPNSNYQSIPATGVVTGINIQNPSLSNLDANLLTLDLPINLVYNFFTGNNSISFCAGISSNTFVKEAYNYHYSNSTNATQSINSFNNFNFAKTLNLAAGFAYSLGKNQLQVEPFLKYPLGGLGSQQLQFGSVGINLKMNIQSFKKQHK